MNDDLNLTEEELKRIQMERLWGDDGSDIRVIRAGEPLPKDNWIPGWKQNYPGEESVFDQMGDKQ